MSKRKVLITGTGALATLFAAKFSSIGIDVTVLGTWQRALSNLNQMGARTDEGEFPVHATNRSQDCLGAVIAFVLVKSWQTIRVARQLAGCLDQKGLAISLQNGIGNSSVLEDALGTKRVNTGVTTIGATVVEPGKVHQAGEGLIWLQDKLGVDIPLIMLEEAGFRVQVVDDIMPIVWGKLIINAAINPLTSIIRGKNRELVVDPVMRTILKALLKETIQVVEAHGMELPYSDPVQAAIDVAQDTQENYSSMLRDIQRNAQTEIDDINGAIVKIASSRGVSAPINRLVTQLVKERKRLTSEELMHLILECEKSS